MLREDMINDAHCHFFSSQFFATLGSQTTPSPPDDPAVAIPERLGWQPPGDPETLADRWVSELDTHGVARAAVMASGGMMALTREPSGSRASTNG
jgi:hypothetical protein